MENQTRNVIGRLEGILGDAGADHFALLYVFKFYHIANLTKES